jgi:hypothetical protein
MSLRFTAEPERADMSAVLLDHFFMGHDNRVVKANDARRVNPGSKRFVTPTKICLRFVADAAINMDVREPIFVISVIVSLRCRELQDPVADLKIVADEVVVRNITLVSKNRQDIPVKLTPLDAGLIEAPVEPAPVDLQMPSAVVLDRSCGATGQQKLSRVALVGRVIVDKRRRRCAQVAANAGNNQILCLGYVYPFVFRWSALLKTMTVSIQCFSSRVATVESVISDSWWPT